MSRTTFRAVAAGLAMFATVVESAPSKQSSPSSSIQTFLINYNFETYPQTITGQLPVAATVINDYDLLNFNTVLVNQTQPAIAGVPCHTAPTCTVITAANGLLSSILTPGQTSSATGPGRITSKYANSPISYFDPYAFYYGCVVADANGAVSTPVACTITVTGTAKGKKLYSQDFNYKTTGALLQPMTLGYFCQSWSGLKVDTLTFSVSNNLTTAALIDNFIASVFGPQNAAVLIDI